MSNYNMVKLRVKNNYVFYDDNNNLINNKEIERIQTIFL